MRDRIVLRSLNRVLRVQAFSLRQVQRLERFLGGFALAALTPAERAKLTAAIYSARGDYKVRGLFDWEKTWFEEDLPPPPAKILVGGAGSGREVEYLLSRGYRVLAFDPAPAFVERGAERYPDCLGFLVGSYEDLAGTDGAANPGLDAALETEAPFDAVLLGWGSFTHASTPEVRLGALRRLKPLCPRGPVLASFWMARGRSGDRRGGAWKLGWRAGTRLAREHGAVETSDGDEFRSSAGFGHYFTRSELVDLVTAAGYEMARSPGDADAGAFPHATLRPLPGK